MRYYYTSFKRISVCFVMLVCLSCFPSYGQMRKGSQRFMFSPFTVLDAGPGLGFHYEFMAGKNMAIVLPGYLIFDNDPSHFRSDRDFISHYFVPGIKFYPAGQHKVSYGIGPSLMLGIGTKNWREHNQDIHANRIRVGVIAMNYVDFNVTNRFIIGLEGGPGVRYLDHYWSKHRSVSETFEFTGQFSFKLGFRF